MNTRPDYLPASLLVACLLGLLPAVLVWHLVVWPVLIPPEVRWGLWATLVDDFWTNWGHTQLRIDATWPSLIHAGYPVYLTLAGLPLALTAGGWVALSRRNPASWLHAPLGWAAGGAVGFALLRGGVLPDVELRLLAMPLLAFLGCFAATLLRAPRLPEAAAPVTRGTRVVPYAADTRKMVDRAIRKGRVCLAGYVLPEAAEVRSILLLGASGTGKSVALTALMHTVRARGDRIVVADPDGAAMALFFQPGDVILNPLDARSVRWDLLAEIRTASDYKHIAESVLPFTGDSRVDEWRTHSQEIFAGCLQTWYENRDQLGGSDEFLRAMARGGEAKLKLLCQGTAAARYFREGGEKMLNSILGTLTPSLSELEKLAGGRGQLFSVRRWVREGKGALWMPYQADQIASLKGPVSCWMRLAVFELLSLPASNSRRMWFFLDELDALGRIQGLKDAMVRARKKGAPIVGGIQSIAQVRAVYGDAEAQTVVEQFKTQLVLSCGASERGGTAQFASDLIGEREVEREDVSTGYSQGPNGMRSTTTSHRRHVEKAVLPSEITQLPDLNGYLRVSGRAEWLRLAFEPIELEEHTSPYEPAGKAAPDAGD